MLLKSMILNILRYALRRNSSLTAHYPEIDWDYFCSLKNRPAIIQNIESRGLPLDLNQLNDDLDILHSYESKLPSAISQLEPKLLDKIRWLPNIIHPEVLINSSQEPKLLNEVNKKPEFSYYPATFDSLVHRMNLIRTRFLGHMSGEKSYFLKKDLADLENALTRYTLDSLLLRGFTVVAVPDLLSQFIFESCGMKTKNKRSQVYHVDEAWAKDVCLSGTAEMGIASLFTNKIVNLQDMPLRFCAVSRCFREEAAKALKEKGIFRVHQFTKVEMFGITANEDGNESELLLQEFVQIQRDLFENLGLHFHVLEMPPCDLGLPAYHKIDMETWMPGRNLYGEISSASNCTDYQSRRLRLKYNSTSQATHAKHCHTINGTACAVPRMLIAIFENFQNLNGSIRVPEVLQPYMGRDVIREKFNELWVCMKPSG